MMVIGIGIVPLARGEGSLEQERRDVPRLLGIPSPISRVVNRDVHSLHSSSCWWVVDDEQRRRIPPVPAEDGLDAFAERFRPEGSGRAFRRVELAKADGRRAFFDLAVPKAMSMSPILRLRDREEVAIEQERLNASRMRVARARHTIP